MPDTSFSDESDPRRDESTSAWRSRTTTLALAFVVVCLIVLAGTPIWLNWRLSALRNGSTRTTGAVTERSARLRFMLVEAVTANQAYRSTRNPATLAEYRAMRAQITNVMSELVAVAPRVDPETARLANELERLVDAWEAPQDARADGLIDDRAFTARIPEVRARRDSVLAVESALDARIAAVEEGRQRVGSAMIERQQIISLILGPLAIIAGVIVAWLAVRERRLARALATAYRRERSLRAESEQRRLELVKVTESKARLLRGFTHDVKNPLGAADGFLELLEDGIYGELAPRQSAAAARARRALRDALTLIADLLDMARAEAGDISLHFEPVEVCALIGDVADSFRGQASSKGLEMRVAPECRPLEVATDATRLRQILGNLVSNAVKYTDRGFIELRADHGSDSEVTIEVADSGRGIPADKQHLLFEEFVRLDPTAAEGVGIGLASTRRIAHAMGAEITVTSELGRGSTFALHLPHHGRRRVNDEPRMPSVARQA